MLAALALGLPAFVLIKVFHPGFFAREDTKTPMLYAGIGMTANVSLSLLLFLVFGAVGIAVATSISGWLQVALLAGTLHARGDFGLDAAFRRRFPRIVVANIVLALVVWGLISLLGPWLTPGNLLLVQVLSLTSVVGGGLLVYFAAAELLGAVEIKPLLKAILGR
jgi:putative peptidoglycan lipid II flippase